MSAMPGYALRRLLNRGRHYDVFDAWSFERESPVIVKRVRPGAPPAYARRLLTEGRRLLRLSHPYLVRAYEIHREPRPSIVMETLPGRTLGDLFELDAPLATRDVIEMGHQMVSVLGYLHRHGLIHADVKPGNATVSDGHVRLLDLSLAQPPGRWRRNAGTPGYLAPEQAGRQTVSEATDVWGLGLLLLEAGSGEDPYEVDRPEYYDEDHGPLRPPEPLRRRRRVPRALSDLIEDMTAMAPDERPSMGEVRERLQSIG